VLYDRAKLLAAGGFDLWHDLSPRSRSVVCGGLSPSQPGHHRLPQRSSPRLATWAAARATAAVRCAATAEYPHR
jgi:hypothetical protein